MSSRTGNRKTALSLNVHTPTSQTSVTIKIETWTRHRDGSEVEKVTEGVVVTYVSLGDDGKPRTLAKDGNRGS